MNIIIIKNNPRLANAYIKDSKALSYLKPFFLEKKEDAPYGI